MPISSYPFNFVQGLSDFWQRFFADFDQLQSMYDGSAVLMGQAYLDMLQNVLSLSLQDTSIFHKEYFRLVTLREDEVAFRRGASVDDDRWVTDLEDGLVAFRSLDNKVLEPTVSLELNGDFNLSSTQIRFKVDPTDENQSGSPTPGFARRALDAAVGGMFDDSTRVSTTSWMSLNVYKGDTIRLLDIGPDVMNPQQRRQADYPVVLVRERGLFVDTETPLPPAGTVCSYVILRRPAADTVSLEPLAFTVGFPASADMAHTRVDIGSVRIYAKRGYDGQDVVEGVDYTVDYELGRVFKIANPVTNPSNLDWLTTSPNKVDYSWQQEVWPIAGGTPPRFSSTGVVRSTGGTTRVLQIALWAPDASVDYYTLSNNFGSLIGKQDVSSEAYRALLRGIFQLYVLGPVLARIESALNVILGFPVVRDDGEVLVSVDQSLPDVNRITTQRPGAATVTRYDFPKSTPLRQDIIGAPPGSLTFVAFEPLTSALTVTDYVEDPTWWHNKVIPDRLLVPVNNTPLDPARRTASPAFVEHVAGASDNPICGDPGLYCGADENGVEPPSGNPIFRRRFAFVLMDRFLKYHTFSVKFNPVILTSLSVGNKFERSIEELNDLILSSKPAHTYPFLTPATAFEDICTIAESDFYQPQRYLGADPDSPELYPTLGDLPDPGQPYVELGMFLSLGVLSPVGGPDTVQFGDQEAVAGAGVWNAGDYFHYELGLDTVSFAGLSPVAIAGAPSAPRRARFVHVYVDMTIGGRRLVENVDYLVDYGNRTVTRLTVWDSTSGIDISYVQLNIGNLADAPSSTDVSDEPLSAGNVDAANVRANYDPAAVDWLGNPIPVTNARDLSCVERAITMDLIPTWTLSDTLQDFSFSNWGFGPNEMYVGSTSGQISKWNGTAWAAIDPTPGDLPAVFGLWGHTNAAIWAVGSSNKVVKSIDQGVTWVPQTPPGVDSYFFSIWGASASDFWIGGAVGYAYHTTDSGASFTPVLYSGAGIEVSGIHGSAIDSVYFIGRAGLSFWNGTSMVALPLPVPFSPTSGVYFSVWSSGAEVWLGCKSGEVFYSSNGGHSWVREAVEGDTIKLFKLGGDGAGNVFALGYTGDVDTIGSDGGHGVIYQRMGNVWRPLDTPQVSGTDFLFALWVDAASGRGFFAGGPNGYSFTW